MAIYHLSVSAISRSAGRSSTAAAAYRSGSLIVDDRSGEVHDYTRKRGVLDSALILPGGGTADRAEFWNGVEKHHKRKDAVLVREVEISLPTELDADSRKRIALEFASELSNRYGVAADVALHAPRTVTDKDLEKDPKQYHETDPVTGRRHNGNWHAHIMLSACLVSQTGELGKKAAELDPIHCQRAKIPNLADTTRARWAEIANEALETAGRAERIDHRGHAERGIQAEPAVHLGPAAAGFERRTGEKSQRRHEAEASIAEWLAKAKEVGELERVEREATRSILDLSGDLAAALAERRRLEAEKAQAAAVRLPSQDGPFPELDDQALAGEVTRLADGLPDPAGLAERRPDVAAARRLAAEKAQAEALARAAEANARAEARAWQDQHPMRAMLGMTGERDHLQREADAHAAAASKLEKERQDATRTADKLAKAAQAEIKARQVEPRARLAELSQEEDRRRKVTASQRSAAIQVVRDKVGGRIPVRPALDQGSTERGPIVMTMEHAIAQQTTKGLVVHLHSAFGGQPLPQLSEVVRINYKAGRATWGPDRDFDLGKALERGGRGR
jgi:hypothetical protein